MQASSPDSPLRIIWLLSRGEVLLRIFKLQDSQAEFFYDKKIKMVPINRKSELAKKLFI